MSIETIVKGVGVIPVLEVSKLQQAAPLAQALAAGGLRIVELTMRTPCALDAVKAMKDAAPSLTIGMGTIRTHDDVHQAAEAGAEFLVSPGASPSLLQAIRDLKVPALPGVATVSEAMLAAEFGFRALKFFPAEPAGGVNYLKALHGPLPDHVFCPTGGITREKAPEYLALPHVLCVGGSWIASRAMIAEEAWDQIESNARFAAELAD
ncbi:MAG: bifunctional 4-hydroxy-2-oxoglutarate aldolase/2-dehydro-3-deoxy-phosphogluconate aldolase [Pseudomonadota bacterium]